MAGACPAAASSDLPSSDRDSASNTHRKSETHHHVRTGARGERGLSAISLTLQRTGPQPVVAVGRAQIQIEPRSDAVQHTASAVELNEGGGDRQISAGESYLEQRESRGEVGSQHIAPGVDPVPRLEEPAVEPGVLGPHLETVIGVLETGTD